MTNKYVETTFLYLVGFSLLIHTGIFAVFVYLPQSEKQHPVQEPIMIDLQDVPDAPSMKSAPASNFPAQRQAERKQRVERQTAPKGTHPVDRQGGVTVSPRQAVPQQERMREAQPSQPAAAPEGTTPMQRQNVPRSAPADVDIFRPGARQIPKQSPKLFPSPQRLAQLEESFRKKYSSDVEEGDTRFLDTDDLLFSGFLRRFETAVYGVWRYPNEAAKLGIEGITPVRITFNKKGEIEEVKLLQSSGSKLLDDEVMRALRSVGIVGPLPRTYNKEQFHLIAFFEYGIVRGAARSIR